MSLVLMGATKWPENIQLLPTLAVSSSKSSAHISGKGEKIADSPRGHSHTRQDSRPFDVLYEDVHKSHKPPMLSGDLRAQYLTIASPSYIKIENTLRAGEVPNTIMKNSPAPPPVVTILNERGPGRTSSIKSRQTSLRRRHSKRNWMARRSDVIYGPKDNLKTPELKVDSKKQSKIDFIFPIRRKTSFKYSPVVSPKLTRFRNEKDIDDFFAMDDVAAAMRALLPNAMNTFEFSKLERLEPLLKIIPTRLNTPLGGKFASTGVLTKDPLNNPPLVAHNSTFNTVSSRGLAISIGSNEKQRALASVYSKYRTIASSTNAKFPAKIEILLPDLCEKLSLEEKNQLNTIFLLEILLRRTVAAKIQFRLRQNGRYSKHPMQNDDSSSHRSDLAPSKCSKSSDISQEPDMSGKFKPRSLTSFNHSGTGRSAEHDHKDSPVYSDLLPSPQITASSRAQNQYMASEFESGESPHSSFKAPATQTQTISPPTNSDSLGLGSGNGLLDPSVPTTHTSLSSLVHIDHNDSRSSSKDFRVTEASGMSLQAGDMTLNAGIANLSLLRPINISTDTLSSSSTMPGNNYFEIYQFSNANPENMPNPEALLKQSSLGAKSINVPKADDKLELSSTRSHSSSLPNDSVSEIRDFSPEVDEDYFYPEFLKVSKPDAAAKSLLPNEDAVLRRQQSMKYYRTIGFKKDELPDTPSSSSSLFDRQTVP